MATIAQVVQIMQEFAPESAAYKQEFDNVGLLVGKRAQSTSRVLCALDATTQVVKEAITVGANLIISHHPVIYNKLHLTDETPQGALIMQLIAHDIAVYSAHTNLDFVHGGINEYIATLLGLKNIAPLHAYISYSQGFGRVGYLTVPVSLGALRVMTARVLQDKYVRVVGDIDTMHSKVAVINGGGGGDTKYIDWALRAGATCLITADVKHHVAIYAKECGIALVEPQHYCMEHPYIAHLATQLQAVCDARALGVQVLQALSDSNPRR
jgi:dinuclear metal center YbgI/SA1388 family protein